MKTYDFDAFGNPIEHPVNGKPRPTAGLFSADFLLARLRGSLKLGQILNDILPRNMGAAGLIFDPVHQPIIDVLLKVAVRELVGVSEKGASYYDS